jgi:hypothetical protein
MRCDKCPCLHLPVCACEIGVTSSDSPDLVARSIYESSRIGWPSMTTGVEIGLACAKGEEAMAALETAPPSTPPARDLTGTCDCASEWAREALLIGITDPGDIPCRSFVAEPGASHPMVAMLDHLASRYHVLPGRVIATIVDGPDFRDALEATGHQDTTLYGDPHEAQGLSEEWARVFAAPAPDPLLSADAVPVWWIPRGAVKARPRPFWSRLARMIEQTPWAAGLAWYALSDPEIYPHRGLDF